MKSFIFQFDSLLRYRRHRRDLCRQLLADVMANRRRLEERRAALEVERTDQLGEIRTLQQSGEVDVDRAAARRYYAGRMLVDMLLVDRDQEAVHEQLERCRQALLQADRDVKALEKLRDKQQAEFLYEAGCREMRELDESWMAGHLAEEARQ